MEIKAKFLAEKLTKSFIKDGLKKGKSESEIKKEFTHEKLNEMSKSFCEKYGFVIVD